MHASNAGLLACLTRGMGYALYSRLSLDGAGSVYTYNLLHIVQIQGSGHVKLLVAGGLLHVFFILFEHSYILSCSLEQKIVGPIIHCASLWCSGHSGWCQGGGYSGHLWGLGHSAGSSRGHLPRLPYIQLIIPCPCFSASQ